MAENQSAAEFILDLQDAFQTDVEEHLVLILKKTAMEGLSRVVLRSPVKTGRFRANWSVSFGEINTATTEQKDKPGQETINKGTALINGLKSSTVIWLSNSLPYANRLENGWSKQAPQGMVALTFAELSTMVAQ